MPENQATDLPYPNPLVGDPHWVVRIVKYICFTAIIIAIGWGIWLVISPILLKLVEVSTQSDLERYVKYVLSKIFYGAGLLIIWSTGYWCPTLPFLPRK